MSTADTAANANAPAACATPGLLRIAARESVLGEGMKIRRALPAQQRRTVGAWCFLDHFGPLDVTHGDGLRVGPHPHTGLQTFTWPIAGEILHRDSLGTEQLIRPGQVNLMTAGRGISHSEESPSSRSPTLHGAQLWIALPDSHRHIEPAFEHHASIPTLERDGFRVSVMAGEAFGERSPVRVHTPLLGLELLGQGRLHLPLRRDFEHCAMALEGSATFCGEPLATGELLYLPAGHDGAELHADEGTRVLVLGGEPFAEDLLMWWNFIGRSKAEVAQFTQQWNAGTAFGDVRGYPGARLAAPLPPWSAT